MFFRSFEWFKTDRQTDGLTDGQVRSDGQTFFKTPKLGAQVRLVWCMLFISTNSNEFSSAKTNLFIIFAHILNFNGVMTACITGAHRSILNFIFWKIQKLHKIFCQVFLIQILICRRIFITHSVQRLQERAAYFLFITIWLKIMMWFNKWQLLKIISTWQGRCFTGIR